MQGLILSLGAPNDAAGRLSEMATDRLNAVIQLYRCNPGYHIICTGGKGEHFNTASLLHYDYSYQYLRQHSIPESALLPGVPSTHTIEDFTLSREQLHAAAPEVLIVVTSDFHIARARLIYNRYVQYAPVVFWGAPSSMGADQLAALQAHELKAIARLEAAQQ
ncbi:MAG TPA: YdcF family protein [Chitinophaga sp.]|uniref:YdcF family protein n=1 Tax=Chitinophaga sp. TaxID=1869181 RepID=UPI002C241383|nr:YdcF family protein [Chitinophaga sp.]HVI45169.1 YdcF family protein [Chitinophaga sp.]